MCAADACAAASIREAATAWRIAPSVRRSISRISFAEYDFLHESHDNREAAHGSIASRCAALSGMNDDYFKKKSDSGVEHPACLPLLQPSVLK